MEEKGYRVAQARKLAGLSQKQLADRLGVSQQAIYYYETGRSDIKASVLKELSEATGCSVSFILGITDDPHDEAVPDKETIYGPRVDPALTEIVEIYDALSDEGRVALVAAARGLAAAYPREKAPARVARSA